MKANCVITSIAKKRDLKNGYYSFILNANGIAKGCKPGHFVHIQLPDSNLYLRRAFSIASANANKDEIEIIFKIFGRGTKIMGALHKSDCLNVLGPLGNPFKMPNKNDTVIMVAGGVGFPPLLYLAETMIEKGYDPKNIFYFYGGRSKEDIVEHSRIKKLKLNLIPITDDGSFGVKGLVTTFVEKMLLEKTDLKTTRMYACGPEGMLKTVDDLGLKYNVSGQLSLEAPMPCGIGICLGCVVLLRNGEHARVCCDGPVFEIGEVLL